MIIKESYVTGSELSVILNLWFRFTFYQDWM